MQSLSNTKIVCTIGPSSWDEETLRKMVDAGMQIARINASFANHEEMETVAKLIRSISPRVTLLLDTMGHKVRVTGFEKPIKLETGVKVTLVADDGKRAPVDAIKLTYPTLHEDLQPGVKILLDDGTMTLEVEEIKGRAVICRVLQGGVLSKRKTVNIPGVHLNFPALTDKDKKDIKSAVKLNYDLLAASFVRNKKDVKMFRKQMGQTDIKLIAKIEDFEGAQNFDEILEDVDGIMVARGDLGVELPLEQVPLLQKQYIKRCREVGKPVIVATQMLESMREHNRPTRAEVSDVANAIMDGTDAVMLSAETSTGKFPVEAVQTITKIAQETERVLMPQIVCGQTDASEETDAICETAVDLIQKLNLKGVIVMTQNGRTPSSISRHRINVPIWAVSANPRLIRQLNLLRGVTGYYIKDFKNDRDEAVRKATEIVYAQGSLEMKDKVAIISGSSIHNKKTNSILEVAGVKDVIG